MRRRRRCSRSGRRRILDKGRGANCVGYSNDTLISKRMVLGWRGLSCDPHLQCSLDNPRGSGSADSVGSIRFRGLPSKLSGFDDAKLGAIFLFPCSNDGEATPASRQTTIELSSRSDRSEVKAGHLAGTCAYRVYLSS